MRPGGYDGAQTRLGSVRDGTEARTVGTAAS